MEAQFTVLTTDQFTAMMQDMACMRTLFLNAVAELKALKDNRLMSVKDVMEYTGFGKDWVNEHKENIGYSQPGGRDIRFYKEDVDKYFASNKIQRKLRKAQ